MNLRLTNLKFLLSSDFTNVKKLGEYPQSTPILDSSTTEGSKCVCLSSSLLWVWLPLAVSSFQHVNASLHLCVLCLITILFCFSGNFNASVSNAACAVVSATPRYGFYPVRRSVCVESRSTNNQYFYFPGEQLTYVISCVPRPDPPQEEKVSVWENIKGESIFFLVRSGSVLV